MTARLLVPALFAASFAWAAAAEPSDFYVSTQGSDRWSGTLAAPNAQGSDGPFATLARARDAVRELKRRTAPKNVVVSIREGRYVLRETVVFGLEDSGVGDSTVTYQAHPGEKPVFTSAVEIGGWKKLATPPPSLPPAAQGQTWVTDLPKTNGGSVRFYTLYDAAGRLPRARSKGFIPVASPATARESGPAKTRLHFPPSTLKNWPNLGDVEIVIRPHHAWLVNILPLVSVNEETRIARTAIPASYAMGGLVMQKGIDSCWVENVWEALDEPGEWVANTQEGKLYLWPRTGSSPQGIAFPTLQEFIRVEGQIDKLGPKDIPVRNLRFRGLTFTQGERDTWTQEDQGLQHDWEMHDKATALIRLRGAEHCVIEQCHFTQSGGGAIRVDLHGQENRIASNHIEHIGGTGVLLCGYGPGTKDVNRRNLVYNNRIHHTGEIYAHSPGIFLWQSGGNRVANNLIHHTPYSGIIVSGVMTRFFVKSAERELVRTIRWHEVGNNLGEPDHERVKPFLHTHDNLIESNEIHHAMEVLGDGNGIYIRGAGSGNVIRRNYIHHLLAPVVMQSAIRTDGGQRDTLIAENVIYRCTSHGIHLKLNNRAENNIIADLLGGVHNGQPTPAVYFRLREGPLTGGAIRRNILYQTGNGTTFYDQGTNPRVVAAWAREADTDYNLFHTAGNPEHSQKALAEAQRDGTDRHSLAADPLFVDPANGNFALRPDSPALKLGFIPIDLSQIGLREGAMGSRPNP